MNEFIHHGKDKKKFVKYIFNDISKSYDFLNHFFSFGVDYYWRYRLVKEMSINKDQQILDVATGTGDVVFSMYKRFKVKSVGLDIANKMIKIANIKRDKRGFSSDEINFVKGDAENLQFDANTFNGLSISFGFRNLGDYNTGLSEFYRVLKPGGRLAILEFSKPTSIWFKPFFKIYFKYIVPLIGAMLARKDAFLYLPESVDYFLAREDLVSKIKGAGFSNVQYKDLTFGVATIYIADKI